MLKLCNLTNGTLILLAPLNLSIPAATIEICGESTATAFVIDGERSGRRSHPSLRVAHGYPAALAEMGKVYFFGM